MAVKRAGAGRASSASRSPKVKKGLDVSLKFDKGWTRYNRWLGELTATRRNRVTTWSRLLIRNMADYLAVAVKDNISTMTPDLRAYRNSITVWDVKPLPIGGHTLYPAAVMSEPKSRQVSELHTKRSILSVKPSRVGRENPAVQVLKRHEPWTLDTLPWFPPDSIAEMVSSEVREDEYAAIRDARLKDLPLVLSQLRRAGVRAQKPKPGEFKGRKVTQDTALMALRMEFGVPGSPMDMPHWKPALRSLKKKGFEEMSAALNARYKRTMRTLLDPRFSQWKVIPRRKTIYDTNTLASRSGAFMEKLRIAAIT